jgi:hypothetical protein
MQKRLNFRVLNYWFLACASGMALVACQAGLSAHLHHDARTGFLNYYKDKPDYKAFVVSSSMGGGYGTSWRNVSSRAAIRAAMKQCERVNPMTCVL